MCQGAVSEDVFYVFFCGAEVDGSLKKSSKFIGITRIFVIGKRYII